jgi:hypothetical protein
MWVKHHLKSCSVQAFRQPIGFFPGFVCQVILNMLHQITADLALRGDTLLLDFDDVDKAKRTDFREEVYFNIIDKRVICGRPIAISTNRLNELDQFIGGACVSRLSIGQIALEMVGADYRLTL